MNFTTRTLAATATLLLATFAATSRAADQDAGDWKVVFEEDLTKADISFDWVGTNWLVRSGHWEATPQGLRKHAGDIEGVLLLRMPFVYGAVRVEYEAMSDSATPGDLSLLLGLQPNEPGKFLRSAAFFGFGTRGNRGSRIAVPGQPDATGTARIVSNQWHRVVVERAGGEIRAFVDGKPAGVSPDAKAGYGGPFLALYAWGEGTFRYVRVSTKDDPALTAYLLPAARIVPGGWGPGGRISINHANAPLRQTNLPPHTLYVSPQGRDTWSGTVDAPTTDGRDGPLATLQAALEFQAAKVRSYGGLPGPAQIVMRGGTYELAEPVTIRPEHGGRRVMFNYMEQDPAFAMTIKAYPGETPVLSGGRRITGFTPGAINGRDAWVADLPAVRDGTWNFRQLWVNGERRLRPRLPRGAEFQVAGYADDRAFELHDWTWYGNDTAFRFKPGDLNASWKNLQDVEIVLCNYWLDARMGIHAINTESNLVMLDRPCKPSVKGAESDLGAPYWVENVREALTEPGEWYLDRTEGRLYYLPMPGEQIATADVMAPVLEKVLRIEGNSAEAPVIEVHVEGLTFSHTEYTGPTNWSGSNQAANDVPGAIFTTNALLCTIRDCRVEHVGTYGIEIGGDSCDITLAHNRVTDLGAGGIKVWHNSRRTLITDNVVSDGGHVFHSGVGILIGNSGGNRVLHNEVFDFDYSAVSVGWTWGYRSSPAMGNVVEYNHLYDIGHGLLSDMGGIYTLGVQPGTRLRYNRIHDVVSRTYGGWGIYTDEGSSDILIENNLAYRCKTGGFNQHYGRENMVRNNIFAFAATNEVCRFRVEIHESFTFAHNVIVSKHGAMWDRTWETNSSTVVSNLYWRTTPGELYFTGDFIDFDAWKARGMDQGSIIADPLLADAEHDDFTIPPDSPARAIGFVPFDLSGVGPRKKP